MSRNAVSLCGHGFGHALLGLYDWFSPPGQPSGGGGGMFEQLRRGPVWLFALVFVGFWGVWYGFMRGNGGNECGRAAVTSLLHNTAQMCLLPSSFFFTHVLMAVVVGAALRGLKQPEAEKNRYLPSLLLILSTTSALHQA